MVTKRQTTSDWLTDRHFATWSQEARQKAGNSSTERRGVEKSNYGEGGGKQIEFYGQFVSFSSCVHLRFRMSDVEKL